MLQLTTYEELSPEIQSRVFDYLWKHKGKIFISYFMDNPNHVTQHMIRSGIWKYLKENVKYFDYKDTSINKLIKLVNYKRWSARCQCYATHLTFNINVNAMEGVLSKESLDFYKNHLEGKVSHIKRALNMVNEGETVSYIKIKMLNRKTLTEFDPDHNFVMNTTIFDGFSDDELKEFHDELSEIIEKIEYKVFHVVMDKIKDDVSNNRLDEATTLFKKFISTNKNYMYSEDGTIYNCTKLPEHFTMANQMEDFFR